MSDHNQSPQLAREMGLAALIFYGVGDILGAGIYGLIGKASGVMGNAVWLAFAASFLAALLTGLSYASLGSRHPKAAGAAYIAQRAFGQPWLAYFVGLAVVASGLTSMATQARAFSGYLLGVFQYSPPGVPGALPVAPQPWWIASILAFVAFLTWINYRGIRFSSRFNIFCTVIEAAGLVFIIAIGIRFWGGVDYWEVPAVEPGDFGELTVSLILSGAVLTFYSFLGFEDMINVTEEARNPERNFPIALMVSLGIALIMYCAVAVSAVSVVPYRTLAASGQPLVEVAVRGVPWFPPGAFSFVALFAIANTALVNFVMGSRVIYGMAQLGMLPVALAAVHPKRRTPHRAIFTLAAIVTVLAFFGEIAQLATATSILLLCVFIVINGALVVLQRKTGEPRGYLEIPRLVPLAGMLVCATVLAFASRAGWKIAGVLVFGIAVLYGLQRFRRVSL